MNVAIRHHTRYPKGAPRWTDGKRVSQSRFDFVNDGRVIGRTRYADDVNAALATAFVTAKRKGWTIVNLSGWQKLDTRRSSVVWPAGVHWCPPGERGDAIRGDTAITKWSGVTGEIPGIGAAVRVRGVGDARVIGYYVAEGWLGLHVMPTDPPEWYIRQNGWTDCGVFGAEIVSAS